jgi:hypothetical protein
MIEEFQELGGKAKPGDGLGESVDDSFGAKTPAPEAKSSSSLGRQKTK